jgi:predicted aspartyl protease
VILVATCGPGGLSTASAVFAQGASTSVGDANASAAAITNAGVDGNGSADQVKIDDVIKRALTAYGGRDSLSQLEANSTTYAKQTSNDSGQTLVYRCERKGNKWRLDLETASVEAVQSGADGATAAPPERTSTSTAYDGVNAWQSVGGEISNLSPDKLVWLDEQQSRQPTLLAKFGEKGYNFVLKGRTQYKQIPVYAIEISREGLSPTTLFLDQSNYLVVASSYEIDSVASDNKAAPTKVAVAVEYSEYRPTAGTVVPFKQIQLTNGKQVSQLELTSVNVTTPVEESLFNRPSNGTAYRVSRPVSVLFDYSQREIVIKGHINGSEEMDFLLDTGASDTIIDRRVAAEHYLTKMGQYDIAAIAGMVTARSSSIKRLELGNLLMNDVPARILDLSAQSRQMGKPIAGIIGTNVISKFLVTLDYSKPSVVFADIDSTARPVKAAATAFTQKQAPFVKVIFNGKNEHVLLFDTGAAFNHIPTNVAQKYLGSDPANVRHSTEGTGLDGRSLQLGTVVVDSVSIAGLAARKVSFTFPSGAEAQQTAAKSGGREGGFFEDSRLGILGNPFFQNFIVTIDYKFNRLLLQPNPIVKMRAEIEQALDNGDDKLVVHRDFRLAELSYQKALMLADTAHDGKEQARLMGRIGNLRRVMAKDLARPEHSKSAYDYFVKGQEKARSVHAQDVEGRILADWSLLYVDNGQLAEAKQTIDRALLLAPQDPNVNVDCAVHLYKQRLFPEAQKYIEKALFLDPNNWQALWYQVKLSENFYDTPRVVATLKEILRFYPWSKTASDKLKSLSGAVTPASTPRTIVVPGH